MPRHPPPHPFNDLVDTLLDAAEEGLNRLFTHLSAPAPIGPVHKRSPSPRRPAPSNPLPPRPKAPPRPPKPPSRPPLPPLPDHYATLGLHPSAHPATIRAAYASLARLYHPDVCPGQKGKEKAGVMMRKLNTAYEVLKDPGKRAEYDAERKRRGL